MVLNWSAATPPVLGYVVDYAPDLNTPFTNRLTADLVTGTSWTDPDAGRRRGQYLVRAAALETTGSGSFINLSQGVIAAP